MKKESNRLTRNIHLHNYKLMLLTELYIGKLYYK